MCVQIRRNYSTCIALERDAGSIMSCPRIHIAGESFVSEMTRESLGQGDYRLGTMSYQEWEGAPGIFGLEKRT